MFESVNSYVVKLLFRHFRQRVKACAFDELAGLPKVKVWVSRRQTVNDLPPQLPQFFAPSSLSNLQFRSTKPPHTQWRP